MRGEHDKRNSALLSLLGPAAPAVYAGVKAPEGERMGSALKAGGGALAGLVGGSVAGGMGGHALAKVLKKDPRLIAMLGNLIGGAGGSMLGAHLGTKEA